ncbi:2-dehydropantoate 2-reductase [Pelagibius litoralis]|uniref:2-dehydropantoate 2-reductase n=1 Tax=Pelagibius litoralis TaxID=374515 RepID=A0A967EVN1_9PROT|nr:2-dehydropantoate 2-reductase [Pelagibius litoralis]NIA68074.1 2-dehydropantoate 2-reductase [Pelagibius litoralis]
MKIAIYGAGAIGGYLGAQLATVPGIEVSLIARSAHLAAMRENGLKLLIGGTEKLTRVTATDCPADLGPQDYVIVALKAHQAWEAAEQMLPLLGPDTAVVTCQNGVPWWYFHKLPGAFAERGLASVDPDDRQWRLLGPQRAIGAVVYPATEIVAPGVIKHTYGDKFALGEPDGSLSGRCAALSRALTDGGLKAPVLENIRNEIWLKLWGNLCFNPISALTRATLDVVATDPGTRALAKSMMQEAEGIATTLGASFRVHIERRINGAAGVGPHRTSMLQDLERGRALEIDALLTAVQEMGRLVEAETPSIDAVLALVQQLGRSQGLYPVFPAAAAEAA